MTIQLSKIKNRWAVSADKNGGVIVEETNNEIVLFKCVPESLAEFKNKSIFLQYFKKASAKLRG